MGKSWREMGEEPKGKGSSVKYLYILTFQIKKTDNKN